MFKHLMPFSLLFVKQNIADGLDACPVDGRTILTALEQGDVIQD